MSLRSRLSSALGALLGEPVPPSPDLAKALDEQRALTEYERMTRRRYSLHLDDIRCGLADAGIPIPEDDDPETTPRRMVRALLGERVAVCPVCGPVGSCDEDRCCATCGRDLVICADDHSAEMLAEALTEAAAAVVEVDAITRADFAGALGMDLDGNAPPEWAAMLVACRTQRAKPAPAVPEARRMAILRVVADREQRSAAYVGRWLWQHDPDNVFEHAGPEQIATYARRLVKEEYLASSKKLDGLLTLTEKGRAALADSARVAS
jgi:hypothetical protein